MNELSAGFSNLMHKPLTPVPLPDFSPVVLQGSFQPNINFISQPPKHGKDFHKKTGRRQRAKPIAGPQYCRHCGETRTCEWRRGPDGFKTLCNACGIRYAKIIKKEEVLKSCYKPRKLSLNLLLNDPVT